MGTFLFLGAFLFMFLGAFMFRSQESLVTSRYGVLFTNRLPNRLPKVLLMPLPK